MSYVGGGDTGPDGALFSRIRETFGFVPSLFRAQAAVPDIVDAEIGILEAVIQSNAALSRIQKESMLLVTAASQRNVYLLTLQHQTMQILGIPEFQVDAIIADYRNAGLKPSTTALLAFADKLATSVSAMRHPDLQRLVDPGLPAEAIQEAVATCAWGRFLCCLANGLAVAPDFIPRALPGEAAEAQAHATESDESALDWPFSASTEAENPALAGFRRHFGFVPALFAAQYQIPQIVAAELKLLDAIFSSEGLTGTGKHSILLGCALAGENARGVALQDSVLQSNGMAEAEVDRLASGLGATEENPAFPLETLSARLVSNPGTFKSHQVKTLKTAGFRDEQILTAIITASMGAYLNVLQAGINVKADFPLRPALDQLLKNKLHLDRVHPRPTLAEDEPDPDGVEVERIQKGDIDAFEILVERHGRRVYRTLIGILGNPDEARDAMQDTFLKAFQHISAFQRRSKFSTWLISIGMNTGVQRLRERRSFEPIDESPDGSSNSFRPRQIRAWNDDPEKLYSQSEMRAIIEKGIMGLPPSYRVVLMLRDIEQLPIEDVASGLGLTISAAKSRLLRGRLMLREALSPHFTRAEGAMPARQVHA